MIVQCENCETRFQLDDERVPITGIRVRCSRCKEAFFLPHPDASESAAVDAIAADAIEQATGAPPPATDLAGTSLDDLEKFDAASVLDEDEEDWEFNHEPPPPEDGSAAEGPAVAPAGGAPSGLELDGDGPEAESSAFGSVEDFGSLADGEGDLDFGSEEPGRAAEPIGVAEPAPPASALESDIAEVIDSLDGLRVDDSEPAAPASETATASAAPSQADVGEPEDWDLLGGDLDAAFSADTGPTHMASAEAAPKSASPRRAERAAAVPRTAGGAPRLAERAGAAIGWLAFAALFVAAVVSGVRGSSPQAPANVAYPVGELRAVDVATSWLAVGGGETLLVVRGRLENPTSSESVVGARVAVDLLDATGRPIEAAPALAGPPIDDAEIRTLSPGARSARLADAAAALSHERIGPGDGVGFAAYFAGIPAAARRVSVRAQEIADGAFEAPWPAQPEAAGETAGEATTPTSRP